MFSLQKSWGGELLAFVCCAGAVTEVFRERHTNRQKGRKMAVLQLCQGDPGVIWPCCRAVSCGLWSVPLALWFFWPVSQCCGGFA